MTPVLLSVHVLNIVGVQCSKTPKETMEWSWIPALEAVGLWSKAFMKMESLFSSFFLF